MTRIKIGHRVIAVPTRLEYAEALVPRTGDRDAKILVDHKYQGCMWNAIRAWKDYTSMPDATHWCVMADDTDVVNNYSVLEQMCVSRFPDAIWTFYSNELSLKHKPKTTPYIKLTSYNIRGIAFLMPVHMIDGYVSLCERMLSDYEYQRDDATCRIYALMNNIPVMTTIPNLVRSYEIKSAMKGHGITRNSDAWQGYDLDARMFAVDNFEERHTSLKSARGTHLLEPMKNIVKELLSDGKTVSEIGKQLGMKPEEVFRLSGFTRDEFLEMMTKGVSGYSKAVIYKKV